VVDYAAEVRACGDRFVPYSPVDPDAPALTLTMLTLTGRELLAKARQAAAEWGLDEGSRVLAEVPFDGLQGLLAGLVAPLAAGGSVIISLNPDKSLLSRRISAEKVTVVAGVVGWNDPAGAVRRLF
jgi:uncharacterized protein (TIGR03089 family)